MIIFMFIGIVIYIVAKVKGIKKLKKVARFILKELFITFIMFSSLNIAASAALHWKYA